MRASHARTLLPAALAYVPFGFVLVRVRVKKFILQVRQRKTITATLRAAKTGRKAIANTVGSSKAGILWVEVEHFSDSGPNKGPELYGA